MSRLPTPEGQTHCAEHFWHILSAFPSKLKPTTRMQFSSCFLENTGPCAPSLLQAPRPEPAHLSSSVLTPCPLRPRLQRGPQVGGPEKARRVKRRNGQFVINQVRHLRAAVGMSRAAVGTRALFRTSGLEGGCRCRPASRGSAGTPS